MYVTSAHVATYNNIKVLEGYTTPVCLSDAQCFYGINIHVSWKQSSRLSTFLLSHWEYEPCLIVCLLHISRGSVLTSLTSLILISVLRTNYCSNKPDMPLHGVNFNDISSDNNEKLRGSRPVSHIKL